MGAKNLSKKDLASKIYKTLGFSKNFSATVINDFIEIFTTQLIQNNKIKISAFGTFKVLNKSERIGRNPKTKKEAVISARRVVKLKTSLKVNEKLNKI
tara:strand:+ start:60 stop:353 length:294 start_codon:yes stop_codon:yes gene_type:complete